VASANAANVKQQMTVNVYRSSAELRPNSHTLPSRTFSPILRPNFSVCWTSAHIYSQPCYTFCKYSYQFLFMPQVSPMKSLEVFYMKRPWGILASDSTSSCQVLTWIFCHLPVFLLSPRPNTEHGDIQYTSARFCWYHSASQQYQEC